MRRILYLLPLLILVNGSCYYDYEEGADLSFYTAQGRLCQKWVLNSIWIDDIDSTGMSPYKELMGKWDITVSRLGVKLGGVVMPNPFQSVSNLTQNNLWDVNYLPSTWKFEPQSPPPFDYDNLNMTNRVNIFFSNVSYKIICLRRNRLVIEASPNPNSLYKRKTRLLFKTP